MGVGRVECRPRNADPPAKAVPLNRCGFIFLFVIFTITEQVRTGPTVTFIDLFTVKLAIYVFRTHYILIIQSKLTTFGFFLPTFFTRFRFRSRVNRFTFKNNLLD